MYKKDLTGGIFERPAFPSSAVENIPLSLTGMSTTDKISIVRDAMKKNNAGALFLSKLDDIMYLMNIRGNDIQFNPVALSYMYITQEKTYLFIGDGKINVDYPAALIRPYSSIESFLESDAVSGTVMADLTSINYLDYKLIRRIPLLL